MTLGERVRQAIDAQLQRIEHALAAIDGLTVERRGDGLRVRGRQLVKRSIEDVRLRFAGRGQ